MPPGFQEWAESVSLWQIIGWSAGVVGFVLFVWKGWPAIRKFATALAKFVRVVDSVADLPEFMEKTTATLAEQDVKIGEIHHEVHYNNGSSVKDAVTRVEQKVDGLIGLEEEKP